MKNSHAFKFILFSLALVAFSISAFADVKIKTKQTAAGQTSESTVYIKGKRQRTETSIAGVPGGAGESVSILQCDLKRTIEIMPAAQAYTISPFAADARNAATTETVVDKKTTTTVAIGGTVTTTITTKDTGERKQMFGYTAKHIITTIETVSSPDACAPVNAKMQQDGWYIEAAFALSCAGERYKNYAPAPATGGCADKTQIKNVGTPKSGYAVLEKMTLFDAATGKETFSTLTEVVELSQATLTDALFDAPEGYKEFKDRTQMYSAMVAKSQSRISEQIKNAPSMTGGNYNQQTAGSYGTQADSGLSANVKNLGSKTSNASTNVGEKKAGVVRIGLAQVKTGAVGDGMNAADLASAVGNSLADYLKAPNVEVVQIEARLPSLIDGEAKRKECDYVLYATVSHKKGGGGGGFGAMFGKAAGGMLGSMIPMAGGAGGAIAGAVVSTAVVTAANASASVKAKDEISIEYKLAAPGASSATVANTLKGKAKSEGEDIITPLIEQAATAIMNAVAQK